MARKSIFKKLITAALVVCTGGVVGLGVNGVEKAFAGDHEHNYTVQYNVKEGETICEHGGEIVQICLNDGCDAPIVSQPTGPIGHKLKGEWELTAPTLDEKGSLVNICLNCDNLLTVELPKLNTTDYAYTEQLEEISCQSRTGTGTYTIYFSADDKGNTSLSNVAGEGVEYSFDVTLGAVAHTLPDGRACEDIAYNLSDPAVAEMIKELHPYIATCEQEGEGYFECAACGEHVLVATTRDHVYDLNADTTNIQSEPACEEAGSAEVYCEECQKTITITLPALGHDYKYELKKEDGEFYLYGSCQREDCGKEFRQQVECEEEITPATCKEKGSTVYSYLPEGETEPVTYTEEIPCTPHTINGVLHTVGKVYNVSDPEEGNGIIEFYGEKATCTENGRGYYVCDVCKQPILVATTRDHVYDPEKTVIQSEPTCEEEGLAEVYCQECEQTFTVTIPALGHTYEYEVGVDEDDNKYLVGICTVCGAETGKEYFNNYKIESMTIPTCCQEGELIYVYTTVDGTEYKETVVLEKTGHILSGKQLPAGKTLFNMATEGKGIVETVKSTCQENGRGYYICEFCQETILVETQTSHSLTYKEVSDGQIVLTCTVCGYEESYTLIESTAENPNPEIVEPTCTQEGKKIYRYENADGVSCGEFVEVIPKSDDHDLQIFSDALRHWIGCKNDGCGYVQPGSLEEHTYAPATCTEPQICTVCGKRFGEALGHAWANACDDTCEREGCTETREPGQHVDLTLDGKCDICGAEVELPEIPELPDAPEKPNINYPANDSSKWFNNFSGCGGMISGVSLVAMLLSGAGVLLFKKGKKD